MDRKFEVAGWVVPYYIDEEDLVGEDGEEGGAGDEVEPLYMRIGPVLKYSIDWTKDKECVCFILFTYRFLTPITVQFTSRRNMRGIFSRCQQGIIHHGIKSSIYPDASRSWLFQVQSKGYIWDLTHLYTGYLPLHWISSGTGLTKMICGMR